MTRSVFSAVALPAGLVLACALVSVWGVPVPEVGRPYVLDQMPQGCAPRLTYCTNNATYPKALIDSLLAKYTISRESGKETTGNRILDRTLSSHVVTNYSEIYYIQVGSHVRVVVQSDNYLVQSARLELCNATCNKCVQMRLNYTFVVLSGDGTALETAAVELPVYCALPRKQSVY